MEVWLQGKAPPRQSIRLMFRCEFPQPETLFLLYLADPAQRSGVSFTVMIPQRLSLTLVLNKGSLLHPLGMHHKTLCFSFIATTTIYNPSWVCFAFFFLLVCKLHEGRAVCLFATNVRPEWSPVPAGSQCSVDGTE